MLGQHFGLVSPEEFFLIANLHGLRLFHHKQFHWFLHCLAIVVRVLALRLDRLFLILLGQRKRGSITLIDLLFSGALLFLLFFRLAIEFEFLKFFINGWAWCRFTSLCEGSLFLLLIIFQILSRIDYWDVSETTRQPEVANLYGTIIVYENIFRL